MGKKDRILGYFFRPASDVNISKTVHPIYLKIKVQRVLTSHSLYSNFQVNRINRFRDIDVGSWPKKLLKSKIFAYKLLGLSMDKETKVVQRVLSPKESNLTT